MTTEITGVIPDVNVALVDGQGVLTYESRRFLEQFQSVLDSSIALVYCASTFNSLALLDAAIPNPGALAESPLVMVRGQGLATWNPTIGPSGTWVLAADDTTPIV
jgi:hypothetical protein